jgi:hypothetical protein
MKRVIMLMSIFIASQGHAQSLGVLAEQNKPKDAKVTTKRVFTDDDVLHATPQDTSTSKSPKDRISEAESAISRLAEKSSRELGDDIVHDNQFPDRAKWEEKLYEQKEKVIAAARAVIATIKSESADSVVSSAKYKFDIEMGGYNDLKVDGLAKAADWERRTSK